MPGGGQLTISTEAVREGGGPDLEAGAYVCITVADTGHGMAPDVLARALEPFYSTKPLGKGTGLGLAQVYGIAQQSGGTVRIESAPDEGTKVRVLLPQASGEAAAAVHAEARAPVDHDIGCASILVVDDDPDVRRFLGDALEALGHTVSACEGGEEALVSLGECVPDLMLLDFAMPGMNGADVAREARARVPGLPIVFVTGYAETEQLEAALGPDVPMLRKPFTVAQLAAIVERHLPADAAQV
jgi:CheY-like chemotaxis protein